jgi:hypothetical protein
MIILLQFHQMHLIIIVPVAYVVDVDHYYVAIVLPEQLLTKQDDEFVKHVIHY